MQNMNLNTLLSSNLEANDYFYLEALGKALVANKSSDVVEHAKKSFFSTLEHAFAWNPPKNKGRALLGLACSLDSSCQWLLPLVQQAWFVTTAEALHTFFLSFPLTGNSEAVLIAQRYRQIMVPQVEKILGLSSRECLEVILQALKMQRTEGHDCYRKKNQQDLSKTLVMNEKTKDVYVLCKYEAGRSHLTSTERKIRTALCFPFDVTKGVYPLCQSTTRDTTVFSPYEKEIRSRLVGKPGIWPVDLTLEYMKKGTIKKLTTFSIWGACDLDAFPLQWCTLYNQIVIAHNLILGLYSMHKESIVHGDIKRGNALVAMNNGKVLTAGLIDFGFSFFYPPREGDKLLFILQQGYYGTIFCTPPEKWGKKVTTSGEEDYFAMDVWALGFLLWQLHFKKFPSWASIMCTTYNKNLPVLENAQKLVAMEVEKTIEKPLQTLKEATGVEELYVKLIYNLMRLNPKERLTAEQAVREMGKIHSCIKEIT